MNLFSWISGTLAFAVVVNEYGKQIPGQMSFSDIGQKEETTGAKVTPIQQPRKLGVNQG